MLTRRQELNTQLQQLIDAVLLALSLLAAHTLRYYGTSWFDLSKSIDPFQDSQWLLIVVIPFGPILLDVQALVAGLGISKFCFAPFPPSFWAWAQNSS